MSLTPPQPGPAIEAVVFDMDDTLYAERDYARSGYRAVARRLADRADADAMDRWMWDRFSRGQADRMFNALSDRFGLELTDDDVAELVRIYREHRPTIEPAPEAIAVLDALAGRVKLGLLSDGFLPAQQYKLDALRLADRFDAVVFTESLGRAAWKPAPAGFEAVARRLNVPPAHCCYVGDNPSKDFVAANALGWRTIRWRRPGQVHADKPAPPGGRPQVVVDSAEQLLAALGAQP